jgi:hypothetical protein
MKNRLLLLVTTLAAMTLAPCRASGQTGILVEDIFGRPLNEKNRLVLVDWEGPIANPAIEFTITPPSNVAFPARAVLTVNAPRMSFNLPCQTGPGGPRKEMVLSRAGKQSVFATIFPDADDRDEDYEMTIDLVDARRRSWRRKVPVHVIDQDRAGAAGMPVTVDFSYDRSGFFKDEKRQRIVTQAARDWAYFLDGDGLDAVPAGAEKSYIHRPDDATKGDPVTNAKGYTGFLVYVTGYNANDLRSGASPSHLGGFQARQGKSLDVHRSGHLHLEPRGNRNRLGWLESLDEADCWRAANYADRPNDLYSVALHEVGHALFFFPSNPGFGRAKDGGGLADKPITDYLGGAAKIDNFSHFPDLFDPESRRGAFGCENKSEMPLCRALPTKLDLLLAQAVGYRLRPTSAFAPLKLETETLPPARVGVRYSTRLRATGGIPCYNWELADAKAKLPAGLKLDAITGELEGIVKQAGKFELPIHVRDYHKGGAGQEKTLVLEVTR